MLNDPMRAVDSRTTSPEQLSALADRLRALAEPRRLRILELLQDGVCCNDRIGDALGIAPNLVSHHLGALRRAGLIGLERDPADSRRLIYRIDHASMRQVLAVLHAMVGTIDSVA